MERISVNIDLNRVEEQHLYLGRNGSRRLTINLIPVSESRYGEDYFCAQGVSKEAYKQGVQGPILGNARIFDGRAKQKENTTEETRGGNRQTQEDWQSDIPF